MEAKASVDTSSSGRRIALRRANTRIKSNTCRNGGPSDESKDMLALDKEDWE